MPLELDGFLKFATGAAMGAEVEFRSSKFEGPSPVSYTHLDVYKRQLRVRLGSVWTLPVHGSGECGSTTRTGFRLQGDRYRYLAPRRVLAHNVRRVMVRRGNAGGLLHWAID